MVSTFPSSLELDFLNIYGFFIQKQQLMAIAGMDPKLSRPKERHVNR
jgi:hypothetical protein